MICNSSANIIWVTISIIKRWVGHGTCNGERRGAYRDFVGKPEGF
jgi:hypothetical protein